MKNNQKWISRFPLLSGLLFSASAAMAESEVYYLHGDHLGTTQTVTNSAQATVWKANYRPFGETDLVQTQVTYPLRFPGQYYDQESGTYYNYYRDYDPTLGRYIQSDPIGLVGGLNTYAYVFNSPMGYVDPTGEFGVAGGVYGAIAGGVGGYISGGWQGAAVGAAAGAVVGAINPFGASAAGAAAGAAAASLLGQGVGNIVSGKDALASCNYNLYAAGGAALGGALGGPLGQAAGRYVAPYRFPVIGRSVTAPGISHAPGNTIGAVVEGAAVGAGEYGGGKL